MAENEDFSDIGELEAVEQQQKTEEAKPELPEKYRGKGVEDIVRMHQEAEKLISRQAQEVGEVRKLADELLKQSLQQKVEPKKEIDFFEDPKLAIQQAVETNPVVLQAKQMAEQARQENARMTLARLHPDLNAIVASQEFQDYVAASPVRKELLRRADAQFDVDSANELLSTFKELKAARQAKDVQVETKARDASLKAASIESAGTGEAGRKIYRRSDLIRLKLTNPQKFASMSDEIDRAYAEGRVR